MPNSTKRLPPSLDLTEAAPLAALLLACRGAPLALDASGVERLGGLCLQVLLAAQAAWRADAVPFGLCEPSDAFADALATLGAECLLAPAAEEMCA